MKKYIKIALIFSIFQMQTYAENMRITPNSLDKSLEAAFKTASYVVGNQQVPLVLDSILEALKIFAQQSKDHYVLAISQIKNIKKKLKEYKSKQYTTRWSYILWPMRKNPTIVDLEINPALKKVDQAYAFIVEMNNKVFKYNQINTKKIILESARLGASEIAGSLLKASLFQAKERIEKEIKQTIEKEQTKPNIFSKKNPIPELEIHVEKEQKTPTQEPAQTMPDDIIAAYATLGLEGENRTKEQAKKAYRRLALQFHPDKHPGKESLFKDINKAHTKIENYISQ